MNQLQTVLDALEYHVAQTRPIQSTTEAIAIVKQMMQAEPEIEIGVNESSACRFLPVGTKLYTHPAPQAVPVSTEPVAWRVWSPDGTNVYQYNEDGDGEPLFTAQKTVPAGFVLVPVEPTEVMWAHLARDIVFWLYSTPSPHHGSKLHTFLRNCRNDIPDWLTKEIPDVDHTPPKGTVAVAIYKAMLAAASKGAV